MNNKFFYSLGSLACLVSLFLRLRADKLADPSPALAWGQQLTQVLICGIALYYVCRRLMDHARVNLLAVLMLAVGVLCNPIYVAPFALPARIIIEVAAMVLFFLCAMKEKVPADGIRKE